jgi:uncharacterized protein
VQFASDNAEVNLLGILRRREGKVRVGGRHMQKLVSSPHQHKFGQDKRDTLTAQCRNCEVRPLCNGGCPKDRFSLSRDGESGQNYLCPGLEFFFIHTRPAMGIMVKLLQRGRPPSDVMALIAAEDTKRGPYKACPCASGRKFRFCHGDRAPPSPFSKVDSLEKTRSAGKRARIDTSGNAARGPHRGETFN